MKHRRSILILGTRGIPAAHGGFETFAQQLALFLAERDWHVIVYCQHEVPVVTRRVRSDDWNGIERRHVSVASTGPRATLEFDWHCIRDAAAQPGVCLVLGYNSAILTTYLRLQNRKIMTNMDGIEWKRSKWGVGARAWLWANEWIATRTSHRLIADHPVIADHIATRRRRDLITVIPYGGTEIRSAPDVAVRDLGLEPGRYLVSIARIEPENNILTIVEAFSRRRRGSKLVVLGTLNEALPYHRKVRGAAGDEVLFPGAIYDEQIVQALRFHARAYIHGHTVGGTNPSLVEALWAGNPVIAHDNPFNRWTAGDAGLFFSNAGECEESIIRALSDDGFISYARMAARRQASSYFNWSDILQAYEYEALALLGEEERAFAAPHFQWSRPQIAAAAQIEPSFPIAVGSGETFETGR
jgi:glycosyltransferase involved in cell wall biosynthesis